MTPHNTSQCSRLARHVPACHAIALVALISSFPAAAGSQNPNELLARADKLADQADWYNAGPIYAKAEAEFHRIGDARSELYAKFGRLRQTAQDGAYRSVRVEVVRDLQSSVVQDDPLLHIRGLALLGTVDLNLSTVDALDDWNQVLAIARKIADQRWENRARGQLGLVAGIGGDIGSAGLALYAAISKAEQLGDVPAQLQFSTWLANGLTVHSMADRALVVIDRAAEAAKKGGYAEIPLVLAVARIRALLNLPEPHRQKGSEAASNLVNVALARAEREHVTGAQTELLNEAGQIALSRNDLTAAEKAFGRAVELARNAGLLREESQACLRLSQFFRTTHQPEKAAAAVDEGILAVRRVGEGFDLPVFIAEKAEVQSSLGSFQAADESFQRATDLVEGLLINAPTSQVKSGMIGAMSGIYLGHFRLVWQRLHDAPHAFAIIESARGRALLDSMRYAKQTGPAFTSQTRQEIEVSRLQRSLVQDRLTGSQSRQMLAQVDEAYDRLVPTSYRRQRKEMNLLRREPVRITTLQSQLRPHETIVEYVLDDEASYAIEINKAGLKVHSLPSRAAISNLARSFVTAIRSTEDTRASSQALYRTLIAPLALRESDSLIVIPDGPLHLIPFGALMNEGGSYLISQLNLSSAPSATIYSILRKAEKVSSAPRPFLGVAFSPPAQSLGDSPAATRGLSELRVGSLKPLRFAREEVTEAAKVFGPLSVTLEGSQASEEALKQQPLGEFRVIHLAAHGLSDEREPDRAALVFAPGNKSEDGLWQAREISRSRLNADVVVLSACETGTGRLQGQEGVMNLARAFLVAGAKNVVASLWSVDDRSTATLMESFYGHLTGGITVGEAFRQAQLDFIRDYGDKAKPYLWAGFEVIGDGTRRFTFERKSDARSAY